MLLHACGGRRVYGSGWFSLFAFQPFFDALMQLAGKLLGFGDCVWGHLCLEKALELLCLFPASCCSEVGPWIGLNNILGHTLDFVVHDPQHDLGGSISLPRQRPPVSQRRLVIPASVCLDSFSEVRAMSGNSRQAQQDRDEDTADGSHPMISPLQSFRMDEKPAYSTRRGAATGGALTGLRIVGHKARERPTTPAYCHRQTPRATNCGCRATANCRLARNGIQQSGSRCAGNANSCDQA